MKKSLIILILLSISLLAQGCVSSTTNNSQGTLSLEFKVKDVSNSLLNSQSVIETQSTLQLAQINMAKMWITEVEFTSEGPNGHVAFIHEAKSEVNLIDGTSNPEIGSMVLEEGQHTSIYFGVEILDTDTFVGITLEGNLTDQTPFRLEFTSGEVFEAEADVLMVDSSNSNVALITFDPAVWFSAITSTEWANAQRDENGLVLITEEVNANLFEKIATSLDNSTEVVFPGGELDS